MCFLLLPRKKLGRKRRVSSSDAEGEMEKDGAKEEEKNGEGAKEEPMEVELSLPLAKKPRTLYSDMEEVKGAGPAKADTDEAEESRDLRKRIQRKRILRGKLKLRMGPPQNID